MGRKKRYTKKTLDEKVSEYFDSISRIVPVTEEFWGGELDNYGHKKMEKRQVYDMRGQAMSTVEYLIPPTVGALCRYLGISYQTWDTYCGDESYLETTTRARGLMKAYLEQELLTRKDVKGIIFNLQNNYGYTDRKTIDIGEGAGRAFAQAAVTIEDREALLKEIAGEFSGDADG